MLQQGLGPSDISKMRCMAGEGIWSSSRAQARTMHWCYGCCLQQVLLSCGKLGLQYPQEVLGKVQAAVCQCLGCVGLQGQELQGAAV